MAPRGGHGAPEEAEREQFGPDEEGHAHRLDVSRRGCPGPTGPGRIAGYSPAMKFSTLVCASASLYCSGGDFMK